MDSKILNYKIIEHSKLENQLNLLNKEYDLIVIDPFHEYTHSMSDFNLVTKYLKPTGLLISHDCYPLNEKFATPKFISGGWSGETYLAFVKFAYDNPTYYYTILNIDTGIGIISKTPFDRLSNNFNRTKQEKLFVANNKYKYFIKNGQELINVINGG